MPTSPHSPVGAVLASYRSFSLSIARSLALSFSFSADPESLPWTTTKASVNEESAVWQEAKRHMVKVGRGVIAFLDKRYTETGTDITPADLRTQQRAE